MTADGPDPAILLAALVRSLPGAAVFVVDHELRYVLAGGEAMAAAGVRGDDLVGRRLHEALPAEVASAHLSDYAAALAGRTFEREHAAFGRHFLTRGGPLRDARGEVVAALAVSHDVTLRVHAEAALREGEARFRAMADGIPLPVWVVDTGGHVEFVNRAYAAYFGVTERSVRGERWTPLVHPEDLPHYRAALMAALGERRHYEARARVRRADGAWRWIHTYGAPRFEHDGRFVGIAGSSADVTDAVEGERALREHDRLKDEFLMTLAHELRGPLAPMRTAQAIFAREPLTDRGRHALAMSERQLRQMTRLVDDLLEASRAVRGSIEIAAEPTVAQHAVVAAAETVAPLLRERDQPLALVLPTEPVRLRADPLRLVQIVENLLTNASKYSDPGSAVEVRVVPDDGSVSIEVRDHGVGIAPEHVERLFQPFAQIDTTIDRSRGGLGLGLAIVRQLVELHGGRVQVRSDGPGHGSTFAVRLPSDGPSPTAEVGAGR